jgi:hypothetical protein
VNLSTFPLCVLALLFLAPGGKGAPLSPAELRISVDRTSIGMGRTVVLTAVATDSHGRPVSGASLYPIVNGRRWGSTEITDASGRAQFLLPLPNPGPASIRVLWNPPIPAVDWIWANETRDNQVVWFQKTFILHDAGNLTAELNLAADDTYDAFLNGHFVGHGSDFHKAGRFAGLGGWLVPGTNVLSVECHNSTGPAGLLARLDVARSRFARGPRPRRPGRAQTMTETSDPVLSLKSDATWRVFADRPDGWPAAARASQSAPATVVCRLGKGAWGTGIEGWTGLHTLKAFQIGQPAGRLLEAPGRWWAYTPAGVVLASDAATVRVVRRTIRPARHDPEHLVGMEWEPWFTPKNADWGTAESVPVFGYYDSFNPDVARQQAIWMTEAGIDLLFVDWTNNLWDKKHWNEHGPYVDDLIRGTQTMLDACLRLRREGFPALRMALLLGLDNGPQTTMTALNEEMAFVYDRWIRNPKYRDMFQSYEGKPLIIPFNGGGPNIRKGQEPADETQFTVRWMTSQLQYGNLAREGYWSWMDGCLHPIPTFHDGKCEALTVTPSFFASGGWTYPPAYGRKNGWTYLESFRTAFPLKPRFLIVNQWNEFAGQPDGGGYGPKKDQFVDCYTMELSDDIEPTSLRSIAYRPGGGWGYYYYNLTRALIAIYRGQAPETTLIAIGAPLDGAAVTGSSLKVTWTTVGRKPRGVTLLVDGRVRAKSLAGGSYELSLAGLSDGAHTLTLRAEGATTRFALSRIREDEATVRQYPTIAACAFHVQPNSARQGQTRKTEGTR